MILDSRINKFSYFRNVCIYESAINYTCYNNTIPKLINITLTGLSEDLHNITIYCNDTWGNMGQSDYVYFTVNTTPQDTQKFHIRNSSGNSVAWFGNLGNVVLKGTLTQSTTITPTANDEVRFRANNEDVMLIDSTNGSMYIKGSLYENQDTLTPSAQSDDFIIRNASSDVVAYVNESGYMFLKGNLYENSDP